MKGRILNYTAQTQSGVITGNDGKRYTFAASEWKDTVPPTRGMSVDFEIQEGEVRAIYRALGCCSRILNEKNKIMAGVLAILFGWLGAHKFYLGYIGPGLVFLLTNTVGLVLTSLFLFIPNFILFVIAIIEGVLYLASTDEEFERNHITGRKPWF